MDHLWRLITFVALLFAGVAHAEVVYYWTGTPGKLRGSPEAACRDDPNLLTMPNDSSLQPPAALDYVTKIPDAWGCMVGATRTSDNFRVRWLSATVYATTVPNCGPGQVRNPVTGLCQAECASGTAMDPDTGQCLPDCPPAGTTEGDGSNAVQTSGITPNSSVCIGGCAWKGGGSVPSGCLNGKCYTFGPFTATGGRCTATEGGTGDPAQPVPDTEAGCAKKGQGSITINGTTTCVPNSKSESEKQSSETRTDDNGTTKVDKKSNTKCEGSKCTTTTEETTTGAGGTSSTKTTTTEEPKQDYCQKNPTALECKEEPDSKWGGSCAGGFVCDGDAVQCAMAREQHARNCKLIDDKTSSIVQMIENASGEAMPSGHPGLDPIEFNVSSSSINQTNPYGTSCPDDIRFSVAGQQVTVPLADICPYLRVLGYTLVAISLWVAFKTLSGAL